MSSLKKELEYFDSTLDVGRRLQRDIQRVVRQTKPTRSDHHLSYFFFSRTLKSLGAARMLWASGFFQDALVISRCIFEACVLDFYIRGDRARLTEKYLAYDTAARHKLSVRMIQSVKERRGKVWLQWKEAAAKYGRALKNLPYEFGDARGWSGKSLREIVRLLDKKAPGVWMDYEFFYGLGSAVAHSSSQSIEEYMRKPYTKNYRLNAQRRPYLRDLPVLTCRWCLATGLGSTSDHFCDTQYLPSDAIVDARFLLESLNRDLGEEEF